MGAQGTATLDFGAFPGTSDTSVTVSGQAGIVSGSLVEAWVRPVDTADHSADEHMVETFKVFAANIASGTGFTIYGFNTSQLNEPVETLWSLNTGGGAGTRIYGTWSVAWAWN